MGSISTMITDAVALVISAYNSLFASSSFAPGYVITIVFVLTMVLAVVMYVIRNR